MKFDDLVHVTFDDPDNFLKIKETLTRIGVSSKKDKSLYQSCHILHKRGRYAIVHFKELFALDGKDANITDNDLERRNTIVCLLEDWGLCKVVDPTKVADKVPVSQIKIIPYSDKENWNLCAKFNVGKK